MDARSERLRSDIERHRARKFWSDPDSWPFDAPEYVFIPRAINTLGKSLFVEEWPSEILNIRNSSRLRDVVLNMREHCAFGRLVGAIQRHNGTFEPIPAEAWNTRDYEQWFDTDFKAPSTVTGRYGHPLASISECWLFVERDGLSRLGNARSVLASAKGPAEAETYLSPYMQLMVDAVRDLGISQTYQSKIEDVIMPYLIEQWQLRGLPESKKVREAMATMLREPESQKGRQANKG